MIQIYRKKITVAMFCMEDRKDTPPVKLLLLKSKIFIFLRSVKSGRSPLKRLQARESVVAIHFQHEISRYVWSTTTHLEFGRWWRELFLRTDYDLKISRLGLFRKNREPLLQIYSSSIVTNWVDSCSQISVGGSVAFQTCHLDIIRKFRENSPCQKVR